MWSGGQAPRPQGRRDDRGHGVPYRPRRPRSRSRERSRFSPTPQTRRLRSHSVSSASASVSRGYQGRLQRGSFRPEMPRPAYPAGQREQLRRTAEETLDVLPVLLQQLGTEGPAQAAEKFNPSTLPRLDPRLCPAFRQPAAVRVINEDTLNAAIQLQQATTAGAEGAAAQMQPPPPLIVNFASRHHPGGGWRNGALAQEEALCYRSSLSLSLHRRLYPLGHDQVLYSPYVLVIRADRPSGHGLLVPDVPADCLPVVSCVTVAALRQPELRRIPVTSDRARYGLSEYESEGRSESRRSQSRSRSAEGIGRSSRSRQGYDRNFAAAAEGDLNGNNTHQAAHFSSSPSPSSREPPSIPPRRSSLHSSPLRTGQHTLHQYFGPLRSTHPQSYQPLRPSATEVPPPQPPSQAQERLVFAHRRDRQTTKLKMRLTLRAAAARGHHKLVLGALGCGVFGNPPEEVAHCWLEVLREDEFAPVATATRSGHWWQEVVFAVYDGPRSQEAEGGHSTPNEMGVESSNYAVFHRILDGQKV